MRAVAEGHTASGLPHAGALHRARVVRLRDYDPGSPLWTTDHVAKGFSNRFQFVMRGYGHTEWNDCVGRINERFVSSGSVAGLDKFTCGAPLPLTFKT